MLLTQSNIKQLEKDEWDLGQVTFEDLEKSCNVSLINVFIWFDSINQLKRIKHLEIGLKVKICNYIMFKGG